MDSNHRSSASKADGDGQTPLLSVVPLCNRYTTENKPVRAGTQVGIEPTLSGWFLPSVLPLHYKHLMVPAGSRTRSAQPITLEGLEPSRLSALVSKTSVSAIPPQGRDVSSFVPGTNSSQPGSTPGRPCPLHNSTKRPKHCDLSINGPTEIRTPTTWLQTRHAPVKHHRPVA